VCVGETEDGLSYSERQVREARGKSTDLIFLPRRSTRKSTDLIFLPRRSTRKSTDLIFCHEWVRTSRYVVPTLSADVGVRSSPDVSMTKAVT
jgi:hypothetical protein